MPAFDIAFQFEAFCAECGAGICNLCDEGHTKNRGMPYIKITPCDCAYERGKAEGYKEGYKDGEAANE